MLEFGSDSTATEGMRRADSEEAVRRAEISVPVGPGGVRSLRFKEGLLLLQMGGLLALLTVGQRFLPLPRLIRLFDARPRPAARLRLDPARLVWMADGVLRRCYRDRYCMKRALLLFHFLRKWGHPARIHFGIRKQNGVLAGHAWLSLDESVFAEHTDPEAQFKEIYAYPVR